MAKKQEIEKLKNWLDKAIQNYFDFVNRSDFPDKPCIRKAVFIEQYRVFCLADALYHCGFLRYEKWCEYICKVGMVDEEFSDCKYDCAANINGKCKYAYGGVNND